MSYTPCPRCGEPLIGYAGSACTNPACRKVVPTGRDPQGLKPLPPELQWGDPVPETPAARARRRAKRKATRAARRRNR